MADSGLASLYSLHLIDSVLIELRGHSAALDQGKEELAQLKALMAEQEAKGTERDATKREYEKHADAARDLRAKADKHEKELYDGKVGAHYATLATTDIREARAKADEHDALALELAGPLGEQSAEIERLEGEIQSLKKVVVKKRKAAEAELARLQAAYQEKSLERKVRAGRVPAALLGQYDLIRKRTGNTGMATIEGKLCGGCGMAVSEKHREAVNEDRVVTCPSCGRLFFIPVPSV